jgi:3-oxoacyl-[acyl-carrier-protein] synthase II
VTRRRAVITGLGPVTPIGIGKETFWRSLCDGVSGIRPITFFDPAPFPVKQAGEIRDFNPAHYVGGREARRFSRFALLAIAAAQLAMEDAQFPLAERSNMGACFASSMGGGADIFTADVPEFERRGYPALSPFASTSVTTHLGTTAVCQSLGLSGPRVSYSSGCTSGMDVVEWAAKLIEEGSVTACLVGSTDAPLVPFSFGLLCATRLYTSSVPAPRPFDHRHDGSAISEGGGALVVEELEHARRRGAPIYAEVRGYGSAGETGDIFRAAEAEGAERAMLAALKDARLAPSEIDCVSPFAPGVPIVDVSDSRAIRAVFGEHAYHLAAPAIGGAVGQMLSGTSTVQLIAMAMALHHQQLPPTINFEKPAPECDLDCVPNKARFSRLRFVLAQGRSLVRTHAATILGQAT